MARHSQRFELRSAAAFRGERSASGMRRRRPPSNGSENTGSIRQTPPPSISTRIEACPSSVIFIAGFGGLEEPDAKTDYGVKTDYAVRTHHIKTAAIRGTVGYCPIRTVPTVGELWRFYQRFDSHGRWGGRERKRAPIFAASGSRFVPSGAIDALTQFPQ
jgi:hypothetical protein